MILFYLAGCFVNMIILTYETKDLKVNYSLPVILGAMIVYVAMSWIVPLYYLCDYIVKGGK